MPITGVHRGLLAWLGVVGLAMSGCATMPATHDTLPPNVTSIERVPPTHTEVVSFKLSSDFLDFQEAHQRLGLQLDETHISLLNSANPALKGLEIPVVDRTARTAGIERLLVAIHNTETRKFSSFVMEKEMLAGGGTVAFLTTKREFMFAVPIDPRGHVVSRQPCPGQGLGFFGCMKCGIDECAGDPACAVVCFVLSGPCAAGFALGCGFF